MMQCPKCHRGLLKIKELIPNSYPPHAPDIPHIFVKTNCDNCGGRQLYWFETQQEVDERWNEVD